MWPRSTWAIGSVVLWATLALSHAINITTPLLTPRATIANGVSLRILPLGDSITDGYLSSDGNGYRLQLWNHISNAKDFVGTQSAGNMQDPANEGYPGATIHEISGRSERALAMRPNVVLLHAGTNDMNRPYAPETAHERLAAFIDKIASECPDAAILVAKIIPASGTNTNARINSFNSKIPGIVEARAKEGMKVMVVDMTGVTELIDGLHPNDVGYDHMGDIWFDAIVEAGEKGWIEKPVQGVDLGGGYACSVRPVWYPQDQIASGVGTSEGYTAVWYPKGEIASGIGAGTGVRFGDLDGDGRDDYLWVNKGGAVTAYLNTAGANADEIVWQPLEEIATGFGEDGDGVRFADINGDGRDDYLWISEGGAVTCFLNQPGSTRGKPNWNPIGEIATGVGAGRDKILFGDINGDGRDDYLVVGDGGALEAFLNTGTGDKPVWIPQGEVASGIGAGAGVRLADVNDDGRVDYLWVSEQGAVTLYTNTAGARSELPRWWAHGQIASGVGPRGNITFADLNGDGRSDYLVIGPNGEVSEWQNGGKGGVSMIGPGVQFHDLNGDGKDDYLSIDAKGRVIAYLNGGVNNGNQIWLPQGEIASGVGATRDQIRFADLDGDGDVEYLVVHSNGAVDCWLNAGPSDNAYPGRRVWVPQGQIASGIGKDGSGVHFADLDGDGRADYLWVDSNSAVTAYFNGGGLPGTQIWYPKGVIATGVGAEGKDIAFADIDGDGRAEYLWVHPSDGSIDCWYNAGGAVNWIPWETIATGVGTDGSMIRFGDLNGDGRADYISVTSDSTGAASEWENGCDEDNPPPILIGGDWCRRGEAVDVEIWEDEKTDDYLTTWWDNNGGTTNYAVEFGADWGLGQTFRCGLPNTCSAPRCRDLDPAEDADTGKAYLILESLANFNQFLNKLREALWLSNTQYATLQTAIQQDFDPGSTLKDLAATESLSAVVSIIGILTAWMGPAGAVAAGSAAAGSFKEIFGGAARSITATLQASDISLKNIAEEAEFVHSFFGVNLRELEDMNIHLMGSGEHEGTHIKDLISDGAFVDYRDIPSLNTDLSRPILTQQETSDWLFKVVLANLVNDIWKRRGVYIVKIPMTEQECNENEPGNGDSRLKLCKDGYGYFIQRLVEGQDPAGGREQIAALPEFWGEMKDKYDIDPRDAIESSVEAFKSGGFKFESESLLGNILDVRSDQNQKAFAKFPGLWTLPVCDVAKRFKELADRNDWDVDRWFEFLDEPGFNYASDPETGGACSCMVTTDKDGNKFEDYFPVNDPRC
ncbi:hypothetical protein BJY04DRAFT_225207 [Aspergillus karnatakaensis]|uniref:uncharacterized protein n=1 Tax=Aspergillus karnatakaensis TaxID=1810916 RepID=UPI003CCD33F8